MTKLILLLFLTLQYQTMSQFKSKLETLRLTHHQKSESNLNARMTSHEPPTHEYDAQPLPTVPATVTISSNRHFCSADVKVRSQCPNSPREKLCIQQPIVICKKEKKDPEKQKLLELEKARKKQIEEKSKRITKKVEPFKPIEIPTKPFKLRTLPTESATPKKQIEIHIEKDDKQCLKKLFKKIHRLEQQLAESEKEKIRLSLELNNLRNIDGINRNAEKELLRVEGENYKLKSDIDYLKEMLKGKNQQLEKLRNKVPEKIVKQIVVEKPVEVRVEVPKYVPGPQKIIEVPTIIENKSHEREVQLLRDKIGNLEASLRQEQQRNNDLLAHMPKPQPPTIIQKPVYLDKPVFVDRPVYVEKPVPTPSPPVQVPVEVPVEVPVYIQKPFVDEEVFAKLAELEHDLEFFVRENEGLREENARVKRLLIACEGSLEALRRHNYQKNHEVEELLNNGRDYLPLRGMEQPIVNGVNFQGNINARRSEQMNRDSSRRQNNADRPGLGTFNPNF